MSLRTRLTGAFTLVVVGGTAVSTLIGSRIITNTLLGDARERAKHGVDAAFAMYTGEMDSTLAAVRRAADRPDLRAAILAHDAAGTRAAITAIEEEGRLDFLGVSRAGSDGGTDPCLHSPSFRALVGAAARGEASGTEVLPEACLASLGPHLVARARIAGREDVAALALVGAVSVRSGRSAAATLYGGVVLNNRTDLVDPVRRLVYGAGTYEDHQIGAAALYLGDVRVAGTGVTAAGGRAIGRRAPPDVTRAVLAGGRTWNGRTEDADGWTVAASQPLRDHSGAIVGMLSVGTIEAPILAVRTHVMLTFLAVCLFGLVVVFAMTYVITRRTISPLETMAAATKRIAGGDLGVRVSVAADDEIGDLAASFNVMVSSLEAMKHELETWGHTLEDKVKERTDQLVAVQAHMARSQKLASIGRLAAGVAHSINNPLGGILSLSMLAAEDCPEGPLRTDLDTIATQALRCREIVKGLLEFSRQADARVAETDVNAIVNDAVLLLQRQSVFHNVTIVRRLEPDPLAVLINPGQLQDAVTNLLVNAVDAMDGGGTLTVETAIADSNDVLVRVRDTGCGIPEEHLSCLFEPFFTTKRVGKGTGLGLAITHGIVTRAGGTIDVDSSSGGTTFTIHLPASGAGGLPSAHVDASAARPREPVIGC